MSLYFFTEFSGHWESVYAIKHHNYNDRLAGLIVCFRGIDSISAIERQKCQMIKE